MPKKKADAAKKNRTPTPQAAHATPKNAPETPQAENERVVLKPIFSLRPGVWLVILYSFVILLAFFFLGVYPGLRRYGAMVSFSSAPSGAAVYVDGQRVGATPCRVFVEAGERSVEWRKARFDSISRTETVRGRVFFTLLFPRNFALDARLGVVDEAALIRDAYSLFAQQSAYESYYDRYQYQPVLSETVRDLYDTGASEASTAARELVAAALPYLTSQSNVRDYVDAALVDASEGGALSPTSFVAALGRFLALLDSHPELVMMLDGQNLPEELYSSFINSEWLGTFMNSYRDGLIDAPRAVDQTPVLPSTAELAGLTFRRIGASRYTMGLLQNEVMRDAPPTTVDTADFLILNRETTNADFYAFTQANGEWRPSVREALVAAQAVDANYLRHWNGDAPAEGTMNEALRNVSWAAANAYCAWLETRLPSSLQGCVVRLPSEKEWELAAVLNDGESTRGSFFAAGIQGPGSAGANAGASVEDLMGGVWEWCSDVYSAYSYLFSEGGSPTELSGYCGPGMSRVIRGGSWAISEETIGVSTRASYEPAWCTDYTGFRPVIARTGAR